MNPISRRNILRGGAVAAGASFVSFGFGRVFGQTAGDDPQTILNLAATAETFACVHYFTAINSADALGLSEQEVNWLKNFLDAELKHKNFLQANGAQPLATDFFVPENLFTDRNLFIQTTNTAENWFIAAYLAATRRFAELGEPLLAATTSQVSGVESEHQALIRLMGGLQPSFQTLKEPLFWNTSDVVPLFQPFLEGGDGMVGPASFPGDDAINQLIGGMTVENVTPFIQLNGQGTMSMNMGTGASAGGAAATAEATMGADANTNAGNDTMNNNGGDTTGNNGGDGGDNDNDDNGDNGDDTGNGTTNGGNGGNGGNGEDTTGGEGEDTASGGIVGDVTTAVGDAVDTLTGGNGKRFRR